MKKSYVKFTAIATVATLASPVMVTADTQFSDVKSTDYFAEAVDNLTSRGIIKGYTTDGTFRPYAEVTRGQAAKMIAGVLGYDTKNVTKPNFKDVPTTHEFYGAIAALSDHGIMNGYASTQTFKPDAPMTRHQMSKVIALAFDLQASSEEVPFTDVAKDYAKYVAALYEHEITTGMTSKTFGGNAHVKRGQLAAFIYRAENAKAPAENEEVETKAIEGEIASISSKEVSIAGNTYDIPASLQGLVNESNSQALTGALVKGEVKGDSLVSLHSLTITAEGLKEKPVVLQGMEQPVASLSSIIKPIEVAATLTIDTPFVEVKNVKLSEVKITSKVQDLRLHAIVGKLVIDKDAASFIQGEAEIKEVQLYSEKAIEFAINGMISPLDVRVPKASVKLGEATKVTDVLTNGASITEVISNYQVIQKNISQINGKAPTPGESPTVESPATGGSSPQTPTIPSVPASKEVTGVVSASKDNTVTINGLTYTVDAGLAGLFNNDAIKNADITVTVQNNTVKKVSSLTIKTAGELNGKGAAIDGKLIVDVNGLKVSNLTAAKDVELTKNVQTAIDFDKVNIKGSLVEAEEQTAGLRNMRVASLGPIMAAEDPVTGLKITIANSSVAFVEIKKVNTELSMLGVTQISTISLEANASISAGSEVILSNLKISKDVTRVELNASIATVEIDTNKDIEIDGKVNFESVKVKTAQSVVLKTEGTIKALVSNITNIELGTNLKVQHTLDFAGEVKPAEQMIINYVEVKKNVNVVIKDENLQDVIVATLEPVEGRYGYATLSVMNAGDRTIKYRLVKNSIDNVLVKAGEKAPSDTIIYNKDDQFIPWLTNRLEVYMVDRNDVILDSYSFPVFESMKRQTSEFEIVANKLIYKTIYGKMPIQSKRVSVINGGNAFVSDNLSKYKWSYDKDGIPTIEIPLPDNFTYNPKKYTEVSYGLEIIEDGAIMYSGNEKGEYELQEDEKISLLYRFSEYYKQSEEVPSFQRVSTEITRFLAELIYEKIPVKDADGNILYYEKVKDNEIMVNAYIEELMANDYTNSTEITEMVARVNKEYQDIDEKIQQAEGAVSSLFVENHYAYDPKDRLLPTTSLADVEEAKTLVDGLPDGLFIKLSMQSHINTALKVLNAKDRPAVLETVNLGTFHIVDDLLSIDTSKMVFREEASVIHYGEAKTTYENEEQLKSQLEAWGYNVEKVDSSFIVKMGTATVPLSDINITTGTISNVRSDTEKGTIEINLRDLLAPTQLSFNEKEKTYTFDEFYSALQEKYGREAVSKTDSIIEVRTEVSSEDIFDKSFASYKYYENLQDITFTFSQALNESSLLELSLNGIEGSEVYTESEAFIRDNTVTVIVRTHSIHPPNSITINGLKDIWDREISVSKEFK